jgi:hypothetical protein
MQGPCPIKYWKEQLAMVRRPAAKTMLGKLDLNQEMGFSPQAKKSKTLSMTDVAREAKQKHPFAVVTLRVMAPPLFIALLLRCSRIAS